MTLINKDMNKKVDRLNLARAPKEDLESVVKGNNKFARGLYPKLIKRDKNLFFSPLSISTALAMVFAGARGPTADQVAGVLNFSLNSSRLHPAFAHLTSAYNIEGEKGACRLNVANALWGQKGYAFLKEFLELVGEFYGGALSELDFVNAPETACETINQWVREKTQGKIKELIHPLTLSPLTRLVLTNAIYFKGSWQSPFEKELTLPAPFYLQPGSLESQKVDVAMMFQQGVFGYLEEENFSALELPYAGDRLSMVILLPKKIDGLKDLEEALSAKGLLSCLGRAGQREVKVFLPKFKFSSSFQLGSILGSMGIVDAFSMDNSDFSGMTAQKDLWFSEVIHKAFVDVNEEGTEAAAATAVIMLGCVEAPPVPVFFADHPFIFMIRDIFLDNILFLGRVMDPRGFED